MGHKVPRLFRRNARFLKAFKLDGIQMHFIDLPVKHKKRTAGYLQSLPPHTLFCECGICVIKPRHYRRAMERISNEQRNQ